MCFMKSRILIMIRVVTYIKDKLQTIIMAIIVTKKDVNNSSRKM